MNRFKLTLIVIATVTISFLFARLTQLLAELLGKDISIWETSLGTFFGLAFLLVLAQFIPAKNTQ